MTVEVRTIRSDIPGHTGSKGSFGLGHAGAGRRLPGLARPEDTGLQARRLLVGAGITLSGQVSDCENLIIEGKVVADDMAVAQLDVLEQGLCTGVIRAENATIAGRFEGRMVVTGQLKLKATAKVSGEIFYAAMTVEDGADIDARLQKQAAASQDLPANVEKLFDSRDSHRHAGG